MPLFPPAWGRQPPKGEKWRPDPGYARMRTLAWIGPLVAEKSLTEQKKQKKQNKYLANSLREWRVKITERSGDKQIYVDIDKNTLGLRTKIA